LGVVEFFTSPDLWVAFLTLFVLEVVLGVDNVVFISILAGKLPPEQQRKARLLGLSLAMFLRIGLLFLASWIVGLTPCSASDRPRRCSSAGVTARPST
jgi:predicted tellurium resistance membrane protein TerC